VINLSTEYLGLRLTNPLVCSSSPLCQDVDTLRALEDLGVAAVVLHSLFEEQITLESTDLDQSLWEGTDSYAESLSYFPSMQGYNLGPDGYLEHLRRVKDALDVPVIASLNGSSPGGWVRYARLMQDAGADALELNVYFLPTDPRVSGEQIEDRYVDLVRAVKAGLRIPLAIKLAPFFTAPASFAQRLAAAGADGLVLFNRFYQPEFNVESLEVEPALCLSQPHELLLRLHWIAILWGQVKVDLAATGGVHSGRDVVKVMMAGGKVAMMTSALLQRGIRHVDTVLADLKRWLAEHEYTSIRQMQGCLSLANVPDPAAFERANYLRVLRSYRARAQVRDR
jgi:dihydroorotate dehydrogenase (fumarate)